jgi:hypothetical protein
MKKIVFAALLSLLLASSAFAETWKNVPVVDNNCAQKAKAAPDAHTRTCALQCAKSGFGIVTSDGQYLKLDSAGNAKVVSALQKSDKKDHLRVTVSGDKQGGTIKTSDVQLE